MGDIGPDYNPETEIKQLIRSYITNPAEDILIKIRQISRYNQFNITIIEDYKALFNYISCQKDVNDAFGRLGISKNDLLDRCCLSNPNFKSDLTSDKLTGNGGEP